MKNQIKYYYRLSTLLISLFISVSVCQADEERIISYETFIKINKDRSIDVREDITVVAQHLKIQRVKVVFIY